MKSYLSRGSTPWERMFGSIGKKCPKASLVSQLQINGFVLRRRRRLFMLEVCWIQFSASRRAALFCGLGSVIEFSPRPEPACEEWTNGPVSNL